MSQATVVTVKDGLLLVGTATNSTVKVLGSDYTVRDGRLNFRDTFVDFSNWVGVSCTADNSGTIVYCTGGLDIRDNSFRHHFSVFTSNEDGSVWTHSAVVIPRIFNAQYGRFDHFSLFWNNSIILFGGTTSAPRAVQLNFAQTGPEISVINTDNIVNFAEICAFTLISGSYILGDNGSGAVKVLRYIPDEQSFRYLIPAGEEPPFRPGSTCASNSTTLVLASDCRRPETPWYLRIRQDNTVAWELSQGQPFLNCNGTPKVFPNDKLVYVERTETTAVNFSVYDARTGGASISAFSPRLLHSSSSLSSISTATRINSVSTEASSRDSVININTEESPVVDTALIIGLSVGGVVLLSAIIIAVWWSKRRVNKIVEKNLERGYTVNHPNDPFEYSAVEIYQNTDDSENSGYIKLDKNDAPPALITRTSSLAVPTGSISVISENQRLLSPKTEAQQETLETTIDVSNFQADGLTKYLVKHDYDPDLKDELRISAGDFVVITKIYGDGWAKGCCGDNLGVFPLTHLA